MSKEQIQRYILFASPVLVLLAIVAIYLAQRPTAEHIRMLPATVVVDEKTQTKVRNALYQTGKDLGISVFAITDVGQNAISVVGLPDGAQPGAWSLDDALWMGTVTLGSFTPVKSAMPAADLGDRGGSGFILPFANGTRAQYGTLGVHSCGFQTDLLAVDLFPESGGAYASQEGDISYVCRDNMQVAIRIGSNLYTHIVDTGQAVGDSYTQGQSLGGLVPGTYNATCGYAQQAANKAHVHFCFPNSDTFGADGYTLNTSTSVWTKGSSNIAPGGYLTATWEDATGTTTGQDRAMFNIFDWLLKGILAVVGWVATTFFLPPGTTQTTIFYQINWVAMLGNGTLTVIELVGAALSTFNWWVPGIALSIDFLLFGVQLIVSVYQFIMGLLKKIPFL